MIQPTNSASYLLTAGMYRGDTGGMSVQSIAEANPSTDSLECTLQTHFPSESATLGRVELHPCCEIIFQA